MCKFILSCTTCATRMPWKDEIEACFRYAPKAGYKAWGVAGPLFWTPGLTQWADIDLIKQQADASGLTQCTEVYAPSFPTHSIDAAEDASVYMALLFDAAIKLGSPLVVFSGGKRTDIGLDANIAGIKALLELIKDKPIRIALEPHYGSQIQFLEDYDTILAEIKTPQVGITLDTGHLHAANVDWQTLVDKYSDRIYNVHVKDHIGTQSVPLGTGEVNLHAYIAKLAAIDYKGALAVELEVEDPEHLPQYIIDAYIYLKSVVKDVTG